MKLRGAKLQFYEKKLFHMFSFMYFASTSRGFESVRAKFLSGNITKK